MDSGTTMGDLNKNATEELFMIMNVFFVLVNRCENGYFGL